ncbi:MAG: glycoside hydrolase family 15 protein [Candidatus Parvarchaeota archaeon]|nr:glycoside hydrolase family 15 protein [Candidatus Parvarchaeota archaeon]
MGGSDFSRIEDHGVLFNNRTASLVSKNGEIDWGCFPNFDSDPVFFSILDRNKGGRFSIEPLVDGYTSSQKYEEDTNILITDFYYDGKPILKITDFLPMIGQPEAIISDLHRLIESFQDRINVNIVFHPFNLSDNRKVTEFPGKGYLVECSEKTQILSTDIKLYVDLYGASGSITMSKGEKKWLVTSNGIKEGHDVSSFESDKRLYETSTFWKGWLDGVQYSGPYKEWVDRSLLVLKGLFFEPSYFMVASPTASLPEVTGGGSNWDYRFMWIRDTAYVIDILASFGQTDEALRFFYSMTNQIRKDNGMIKSVYPISNREALTERVVDLDGYKGSKPVRFGNEASGQFQLDQYGALINAVSVAKSYGAVITAEILDMVKETAYKLIERWEAPDRSIWEIREEDRQYVYSKVTAWNALKNAEYLLEPNSTPEELERIRMTADNIKDTVMRKGVDRTGSFFVQFFGSDRVDTALLRLPIIGFCDVNDEIFQNTLKRIEERLLVGDFLFKRYETERGIDLSDNGFLLVSFWYVEILFMMGNVKKAKEGLEKLLSFLNDLHLLPEEISFNEKKYLGNYPLGLSHVGLMSAILRLSSGSFNVSADINKNRKNVKDSKKS